MAEPRSGRDKAYEPDDPVELVGVRLGAALDDDALREMALAFVEEYALLGWPRERILRLFASPRFAGPHRVWRALGENAVRALVATAFPELRGDDARSLDEEGR